MIIEAYDKAKGKDVKVGVLDDDGKFTVKRDRSKHFMRVMKSWGIQEEVYQALKECGAKQTQFDIKGEDSLICDLEDWEPMKIRDFGHGPQRFMAEHRMRRVE